MKGNPMTRGKFLWIPAVIAVIALEALRGMWHAGQDPRAKGTPVLKVEGTASGLAFAPDGMVLACDLVLRDLVDGKELVKGALGDDFPRCTYIAFSPDGKRLASVHFDTGLIDARHALCLWEVGDRKELRLVATLMLAKDPHSHYRESLYYLTFSPDGKMLATRHPNDTTVIWETATGKEQLRLDTQGLAVAFAPDGRTLTSVSRDGLVRHWDLATKKCVDPKEGAQRKDFLFVDSAVASADGKILALSDGYSVVLKDACSGKTLRHFDGLEASYLALSPDGKVLAAKNRDGVVLLDRRTGKEQARLSDPDAEGGLVFSPDGKSLAVASRESVSVWKVRKLARPDRGEARHDAAVPMPLEATLSSTQDTYALDLGGKTPEEFARQVKLDGLPPSPKVDLLLSLRNTGDKKLAFHPDVTFSLYVVGPGAMNHPEYPYQTGYLPDGERPKDVTLAPGETYTLPIRSLDLGYGRQSYWVLPGDYTLVLSCMPCVTPTPEGSDKVGDDTGFVNLHAPPLRVKVVVEKK